MRKVRVGLVGTGLIAQVMHLHYLAELADRFDVAAVCDLDGEAARVCAERYGIPAALTDWRELLAQPLDAVMVLTSGSHAPNAEAAARAGGMCSWRSRCVSRPPRGRPWWPPPKRPEWS